jgi:hypothetical protein
MKDASQQLERLLRSAAQASDDASTAPPFGFETRVVALWRSGLTGPNGLSALLRRVALISSAVLVIATAAAVREVLQNRALGDSSTNEFAIADTAIQTEFAK